MKYECHGHIILNGVSYRDAISRHITGVSDDAIIENLRTLADIGVGFFRDGGDNLDVSSRAKALAELYGIDYRTPAFMIHKRGHYGALFGKAFDDLREFRERVREAAASGADFIKLAVSGMLDLSGNGSTAGASLPPDQLFEMVRISHGEGFAVMAHVNGADNIKKALDAGVSSIEHGFWADETAVRMLPDTGAVWVPTRTAISGHLTGGVFDDTLLRRILNSQAKMLQAAYSLGALIATGSDSGASRVPHGQGTQDEYAGIHALGIDPSRGNGRIAELFRRD